MLLQKKIVIENDNGDVIALKATNYDSQILSEGMKMQFEYNKKNYYIESFSFPYHEVKVVP